MTRDELFKIALETRNLEIELFWKRATFFWAFQASALALVAVCVRGFNDGGESQNLFLYWGAFLGLILGTFASLAGYLASRGSKYWQKSWEMKLDYLDDNRLFRTQWRSVKKLNGEGAFSVTKLTSIFFLMCFVSWVSSLAFYLTYVCFLILKLLCGFDSVFHVVFSIVYPCFYFSFLFIVLVVIIFVNFARSTNYEKMTANSEGDEGFYNDGFREELNSGDATFKFEE